MATRVRQATPGVRPCLCGCNEQAHQHHRGGRDCGLCGREVCAVFRPALVGEPEISWPRALLAAGVVIAGLYVVVILFAMLRNVP